MVNRSEFEDRLQEIFTENVRHKRFITSVNDLLMTNHSMTPGQSNKYLCGKEKLSEATIEELYWLWQSTSLTLKITELEKYFTQHEVVAFAKSKLKTETVDSYYPIIFDNVLQVADDQWITTIDANMLYDLYKKQIINYNKNTQRPSVRREKDGIVEYKIAVNRASVNEIASLMKQGLFIPNGITLNLNADNTETDFEYKNGEITLFQGNMDIVDGFHRYQALMKNKLEDENFNYTMQLNIMSFDENKAMTFIAQEDKRNKINKSVVRTMDSTNPINMVIQRLNDDSRCYLYGQIGRTETDRINSVWLYDILKYNFDVKSRQDIVETVKYLKEIINTLIEDELFDSDFITLTTVFTASRIYKGQENYIDKIEQMVKNKGKLHVDKFKLNKINKSVIKEIENLEGND